MNNGKDYYLIDIGKSEFIVIEGVMLGQYNNEPLITFGSTMWFKDESKSLADVYQMLKDRVKGYDKDSSDYEAKRNTKGFEIVQGKYESDGKYGYAGEQTIWVKVPEKTRFDAIFHDWIAISGQTLLMSHTMRVFTLIDFDILGEY